MVFMCRRIYIITANEFPAICDCVFKYGKSILTWINIKYAETRKKNDEMHAMRAKNERKKNTKKNELGSFLAARKEEENL